MAAAESLRRPFYMEKIMVGKLAKLGCVILCLMFFFGVAGPWLYSLSSAWQRFYAVQDEYDLHSGALYYCDVPVTLESELHVRESVREGMKDWLAKH